MNFKEILERYKNKTATEEEVQYVESEIEKNELITEYLSEQSEWDVDFSIPVTEESTNEVKKIKKSIKKKNRILLASAVAIIICLAVCYQLILVPFCNYLFYNPLKKDYSEYASNMEVCLSAYTELHFPAVTFSSARIENTGIGTYDITTFSSHNPSGNLENISLKLTRGKLSVPQSFFQYPYMNTFSYGTYPFSKSSKEELDRMKKYLRELPEYVIIKASISFDRDLNMEELVQLSDDSYFAWAGIRNADQEEQNIPLIGFEMTGSGPYYEKVNDLYEDFEISEKMTENNEKATAKLYEDHFISMLKFQLDHLDFLNALDSQFGYKQYYNSILNYVKENGVKTYGVVLIGSPKDILELCENDFVCKVELNDLELSKEPARE